MTPVEQAAALKKEAVAFYPITCSVFLALGYDSIICVGAIFLAGLDRTTFSTINALGGHRV